MPKTQTLDAGIVAIDTEMAGLDQTVAAFVVPGERPAVIETGPATVTKTLTEGLRALGLGPNDVASFVLTHIHLDHGGASGDVARLFPKADIVVHPEGARHLADRLRHGSCAGYVAPIAGARAARFVPHALRSGTGGSRLADASGGTADPLRRDHRRSDARIDRP